MRESGILSDIFIEFTSLRFLKIFSNCYSWSLCIVNVHLVVMELDFLVLRETSSDEGGKELLKRCIVYIQERCIHSSKNY